MICDVVIPAFNEEHSLPLVLRGIDKKLVREIVVVNNASTDATAQVAIQGGARVINQNTKGYGAACWKGLEYIFQKEIQPDIIAFLDADYSDHPEELESILKPIINSGYQMVIGSRALGLKEKGAMAPQQIFGNWLATRLIYMIYQFRYTDLGPFRAIKTESLKKINMQDRDFGWTVEMQIKALKLGLKVCEVPVSYRKRIGVSKITGTIKGTVMAGYKIITTIFKSF